MSFNDKSGNSAFDRLTLYKEKQENSLQALWV